MMTELRCAALLGACTLAACSEPGPKAPPAEILCAAESLHLARAAVSRADEDVLRAKSDLFTSRLSAAERTELLRQVDQLSDQRGTRPLVAAATCESLLTVSDRRALAVSKAQEERVHYDGKENVP